MREPTAGRGPGALAGAAAVGVAFGVGELSAGLLPGAASLLDAVGQVLIPRVPLAVKQWAIAVFGTADKAVLLLGTVAVGLAVGALAGAWLRWWATVTLFVAFGVLGGLAAAAQPGTVPAAVVVTATAAVVSGLLSLRGLHAAGPEAQRVRPTAPHVDRRRFLALTGGAAAVAIGAGAAGRLWSRHQLAVRQRAAVRLPPAARPLGPPPSAASLAVPGLTPVLTATADFFRIDTALSVPRVPLDRWRLRVTGLAASPFELTYDQLTALPLVERDITLACVSNEVGGDLIGTARWLGVPLSDLLERARPLPAATQIVGRAVDGFTTGFPTVVIHDGWEALVAVGMNGQPLPLEHGFPARLVVAGLYGYVSATKWLTEVELTRWEDHDAYWVPRGWAKQAPIKIASRIDVPRRGATVAAGEVVVAGVAWAPPRGVAAVEVQVDDGDWTQADLAAGLSDDTWVQWRTSVGLPEGRHRLRVRATASDGERQPAGPAPPRPDGVEGWHAVTVEVTP